MSGATFGRKGGEAGGGGVSHDPLAARRAAFLAEERTRRRQGPAMGSVTGNAYVPVFVREKSMGTAYLLWFFLGGVAGHRFYLGFPVSAAVQMALMPLSYAFMAGGSGFGIVLFFAGGLWVLGDGLMIPGLLRQANENARRNAVDMVFD
jgi:TM2 domain-containing membrane protein YozV